MGRYTEAILDADAALALNQESNFKQKLITRIAHACILSNQLYPLRNLHLSVDDKQKVDAFIKRSTNSTPFSDESILKLSRLTITPMANGEYFPIGHDSATSALAGAPIRVTSNESDEEGVEFREDIRHRVDLNHCTKDNPLGVLFGGVGDARHVLITLVDFYEQMKKFPKSRRNNVKISLLLNDLNPCVLARIVVLFLALEEMSHFKSVYFINLV